MALKKAFSCLSLRLGTLIFLYSYSIYVLWVLFQFTVFVNGPSFKEVWNESALPFIGFVIFWVVEFLIFSATIISISNQTPSTFLIWTNIVFFVFHLFAIINGNLEMAWLLTMQENIQYSLEEKIWFVASIIISILMIHAILVFYGYIIELKKVKKQFCCDTISEQVEKEIKHGLPTFHNEKPTMTSPLYPKIY